MGIVLFALGGLILAGVPVALAADVAPSTKADAVWLSILLCIIVLGALMNLCGNAKWAGPSLGVCAVFMAVAIKGVLVPSLPELNVSTRVSDALIQTNLHPRLSAGKPGPLIGVGYQEPSLIFATRSDSALSSIDAAARNARIGAGVVVARDSLGQLNATLLPLGVSHFISLS